MKTTSPERKAAQILGSMGGRNRAKKLTRADRAAIARLGGLGKAAARKLRLSQASAK